MQTKRIRSLHIIIILLLIITIISLTFAGVMGALYVREVKEVGRLRGEREQLLADQALPALSVDVEDGTSGSQEPGMEDAESAGGQPVRMRHWIWTMRGSRRSCSRRRPRSSSPSRTGCGSL